MYALALHQFPFTMVISSQAHETGTHTWRATLDCHEVLDQGLIKRIGDGTSTKIWSDGWIPHHFGARSLTPIDGHDVTTASDLLSARGQWKTLSVKTLFRCMQQYEDVWAWEHGKHGIYSVRLAYRILDTARIRGNDVNVASASGDDAWKKIWKLKVPPKVRVF